MSQKTWNIGNMKRFITEFQKIDGAEIVIETLDQSLLKITYRKGSIHIPIVITPGMASKYLVSFPSLGIQSCATDNLREVEQAVEVALRAYLSDGKPIEAQAKIKAGLWGKRLITIERTDGYRTNLYVSYLLAELIRADCIHIGGFEIKANEKGIRCKYSKDVLDYGKIQREGAWDQHDQGFASVKELREADATYELGYMHPSMSWQIGRIF